MNNMSFVKAMGIGIAVGSVIGLAMVPKKKKCTIGKTLKSVGNVLDHVCSSIGL